MPRRPLHLETFEDRILCSATVPVDPALDPHQAVPPAPADASVPAPAPVAPDPAAATVAADAAGTGALTDAQRAAIEAVVRDSTEKIFFEQNVGQFAEGVRYGFKTTFGSMLVYDDHLRLIANQTDPLTGEVGQHIVDIRFPGSGNDWEIVPGGASGAVGSYQQADGTSLTPDLFTEITLRGVYNGVDLRLYSADKGVLEFDWILARAQDYSQIRIAANGQDGIIFNADGSATFDLRYQDLAMKMPEVYQVIDGQKHAVGAAMVAGENAGEIRYELSGDIVADQPLVIDPNIAWSTYFDLSNLPPPVTPVFDSYVFAINVNANGVYVSGWTREIITTANYGPSGAINIYMEVASGFAEGTAINQGYIFRLNTAGTNITAWTGTGIVANGAGAANQTIAETVALPFGVPSDLELFPDGRVLLSWTSGLIQIYSADLSARSFSGEPVTMSSLNSVAIVNNSSFYVGGRVAAAIPGVTLGPDNVYAGGALGLEGAIVRHTLVGTTPTPDWATYVGGAGDEYFTAIALTPDKSRLVFSTNTVIAAGPGYPGLVNAVDSTLGAVGTTELLVGVLPEQATAPAAFTMFSYLGGTLNEGTLATNTTASQITATNTHFYVAGNTASTDLPGTAGGAQAVNAGGAFDVFASRIALTGGAAGFQSTYLGGNVEDNVGGIAVDTRSGTVLLYGTTLGGTFPVQNSTPASGYYDGTLGGGQDIFISTFSADLTVKQYASIIGGAFNDYLGQTGDLIGQGHMGFSDLTGLAYLATTVHSNLPQGAGADNALAGPGKDKVKSNADTASNDIYYIVAFNANTLDFGDAPATYDAGAGGAAREGNAATIRLGLTNDSEGAPFSSADALGDDTVNSGAPDDEDSIAVLSTLAAGQTSYSNTVSVLNNSGAARTLHAWIDFDQDGVFESGEYASVLVPVNAAQQNVILTWSAIPAAATRVGQTFMRLRLSDAALVDNVGTPALDERSVGLGNLGEVEDYALTVIGASVAGTVYRDNNNNGAINGGETGIGGATVTLTGTDSAGNAVSLSTLTAADGTYSFTGLRSSNASGYTVTETQPAAFLDGRNTAGTAGGATVNNPLTDVISGVVITPGLAATGYNFGELTPSSLAGTVYRDMNNDGIQLGAGETGIAGATITLTGTDDLGGAVNVSAVTDAAGAYSFTDVRPGTYVLTETQPAGFFDGLDTIGTPGGTAANDVFSNIVLGVGVNGVENNFGELPAASLSGTVYNDANNNGVIDGAEAGVAGATVTLTGTDDLGAAVNVSVLTDAAGAYTFTNLRPGTYALTETQPAGLLDGTDTIGTPGGVAANDAFSAIVLAPATDGANNNFGELTASAVSGTVFNDLNNNGAIDGAEAGIAGVSVTLTGTDDLGNPVSVTVLTDAAGNYAFGTLRPGSYTITETQPAGLLDGTDTAGTLGGSVAVNDAIGSFTLASGETSSGNLFAELTPSSLSGTVYNDANNNGVIDGAEAGVAGATVTLTGTDDLGAAVNVSVLTDAAGAYTFTNLRPGTYALTETQPAGLLDGTDTIGTPGGVAANDAFSAIVLAPATDGANNNFGELTASAVSGTVFNDLNNNGAIDGAEAGIAGVSVTLTGTDDLGNPVSVTVLTDAAGNYAFGTLRPGSYTITETQPAGLLDGTDTAGTLGGSVAVNDAIGSFTLASGETSSGNLFAELTPSSLSGTVYNDANNNGVIDGAEAGVAGATVTLTGTDDLGAAVNVSVLTDAAGAYTFGNLRPGTYALTETQPAGLLDGTDTIGTPGGVAANDAFSAIVLAPATDGANNNFGELTASAVSGTVFNDLNNNGAIDGAEAGIAGVSVTLTGTDDLGNPVSVTVLTDAAGNYAFGTLRPGSYTITETQPAGLLDGTDTAGTLGGSVAVNDAIGSFTLASGETSSGNLFAELTPSSLSGTVYNDANNNGVIDGAEAGVAGATVTLTGTDDLGAAVNVSVLTDAAGAYTFTNLRPGTYALTETQPAGLLDGTDTIGTPGGVAANDAFSAIVLAPATDGANNNFGELTASAVSGTVFNDLNNNGAIDGAEAGIAGVSVTLTGTDDLGNPVSVTVLTDAAGNYAFGTLRPGSYTITETQPAGLLDGTDTAGTLGGSVAVNDAIGSFTLASGETSSGNLFAELTPSSLSGTVYNDANNNGVIDGAEAGVAGATVTLTGTDDLGAAVNVSVLTDAAGAYTFTNLRPGTYALTETQPAGLLDGTDTIGTPGGVAANDAFSAIVLAPATDGANNNFGELTASAVSGTVFNDLNNNGAIDGAEAGIAGVSVTLTGTDDLGNPVSVTVLTDASGNYAFGTLRPGSYTITETQPAGLLDGTDTAGTLGGSVAVNDAIGSFTLASGETSSGNLFAELTPSSLSGTVYNDANNNGVIDGAEAGVAGATVTLTGTDDLGAAVNVSVLTDAAGAYTFTNLRPGTYALTETQPAGLLDGTDTIGTPGGVAANDAFSAIVLAPATDGANNNFGELTASAVSGTVFNDLNNNGAIDGAEAGIAGVSVTLTGTDDLGNPVSVTVLTDAAGNYAFGTLRPGSYTITETQPAGLLDGTDTAGTLGGSVAVNDAIGSFTLASGETSSGNLFAELTPSSLSGTVYNDANNNGVIDGAEAGVAGATVTLTGTDDLGAAVNVSVLTDAAGAYTFGNLRPGTYALTETQPAGLLDGTDTIGTPGGVAANDAFSAIVLAPATDGANNNFGELSPASISGSVYVDADNDGVFDPGETPVVGATVTLTGTDDLGNPVSVSVLTQPDGSYIFGALRPSDAVGYTITETQPAGLLDGQNAVGTAGGATTNNPPSDVIGGVVLTPGATPIGYDFAELRPATLSGTVFRDDSNDGTQQPGEPGVENVTVTLTGTDDLGNAVNVSVLTLADGSYSFGNLRPGTYAITETQPAGLLDGLDALGTAGGTPANDSASGITLAEGQTGTGYTFGELAASSLSGAVFSDLNNDGIVDVGEAGIVGVAVTLTGTDDLGNAVSVTTATGAGGAYTFGNLRPGTYIVTETQPAGLLDGRNTAGTSGGTTVNNPLSDVISAITLPSNTTATGYVFGELAPASFGGSVFHDLNNDGVNDPTDLPIAGATVTLTGTDDLGNAVNVGAISAADGSYSFANLRPGTYTLTETQPAGYIDGTDTAGSAGGTAANDSFSAIALVAGQTGGGYLFGERTPPDLVVTKSDGISIAKPGELLTYTITVTNASLQQADGVTVTDQFPSALQFISASNGGVFDPLTGIITWNAGVIAGSNAQTVTLTVIARVPATLPPSLRSVTNTVTATDIGGVDANPANNTAADRDGIPAAADLYILKTDNLATAKIGQQISYTITGGNAGEQTAEGVIITDTLPAGLRFVSASNGGKLVGGRIVWNLGDLAPGANFELTVRVVVEAAANGRTVVNSVTITDRFGSFEDLTPLNNSAADATKIDLFAFDTFHNFASHGPRHGLLPHIGTIDVTRDALLPLAPVYSGEADPGATLVVTLYNSKGERIGSQTVMVDAGGNWLTTFASSTIRDTPSSVRISLLPAPSSYGDTFGHNLRAYFSPALNPGHFFDSIRGLGFDRGTAPLLQGLGLENPLQLGTVKYGGEMLGTQGTASGQ